MGTVIGEQARTLLTSVVLGLSLALLYDLLRAVRLRRRGSRALTGALDAVYCLALALSGLAFALRIGGGELRLYVLFAAFAGAALFFAALSPLLRPLWDFWARTLFELLRLMRLPLRALKKGRRGWMSELNGEYWSDAVNYLKAEEEREEIPTLFDMVM